MSSVASEPRVIKRVRWTVDDYFRMSAAGVFDDRRVELLDGEIIKMFAQANPHRFAITKAASILLQQFPTKSHWVVIQGTLVLSKRTALDPDLHVFDVAAGTPDHQLPLPFLVIEVSDTSYRKDSGPKLRAYAAANIRDYWIVNISTQRVEIYRSPENATGKKSGWRYASTAMVGRGQQISPLTRSDISIAVESLLP